MCTHPRLAFITDEGAPGPVHAAVDRLRRRWGAVAEAAADLVVAVGGNGTVLRRLARMAARPVPVFGMSAAGAPDFLTNRYAEDGLPERLATADPVEAMALRMRCRTTGGATVEAWAYNEVALFRRTRHMLRITVLVDGRERLPSLVADGILVATPIGSTAYNLSAHGPVLPLQARALALTPIAPARPRRWPGAILPEHARIRFLVQAPEGAGATATADAAEVVGAADLEVCVDRSRGAVLLFDRIDALHERQLREQFPASPADAPRGAASAARRSSACIRAHRRAAAGACADENLGGPP